MSKIGDFVKGIFGLVTRVAEAEARGRVGGGSVLEGVNAAIDERLGSLTPEAREEIKQILEEELGDLLSSVMS